MLVRRSSLAAVFVGPISVALAVPAPAQGFVECTRTLHVLEGEAAGDSFGWVSSPVPDVNGDGAPEILVGAPFHAAGAGRAYLYDGRTGAELFHADGLAGENQGFAVRDAGDLDGDAIGDLVVGGPGSGGVSGVARVLSGVDGSELFTIRIGAASDAFGFSVCGAGDVDQDGVDDVAVGARLEDTAGADAGAVFVVSGADGTTVLRSFFGVGAGDHFGSALALLGDVTGDGRPELVVGAMDAGTSRRGRAYVYDLAAGALLHTLAPDATTGAQFGQFFVASAGEIDGDGFPDVYVGDYADNGGRGKAYFFSGTSGARLRTLAGGAGDGFGIGRPIGDLDGDGRTEMLLGSYTESAGASLAGKAEIFAGSDGHRLRTVTSTTAGEGFGFDAHGIGDLDGDGVPEMVVTAATHDGSRGRVYVVARQPVAAFGAGLAGTGGLEPVLEFSGCPVLGGLVSLDVSNGRGGAAGTLLLGASLRALSYRGGTVYPGAPLLRMAHRLNGSLGAAGAGTTSMLETIPADPTLAGATFYAQALYVDGGAPLGVAFTAAVRIDVF